MIKKCELCNQEKEHHAKGLCYNCYKKTYWSPKVSKCERCGKTKEIHAKKLCASCYNIVYHSENLKAYNQRKSNKITISTHKKLIKECAICGFDKIVEIHHIDFNKNNNEETNLVGLCPNHCRMARTFRYRAEIYEILEKKGYIVQKDSKYLFYLNHKDAHKKANKPK